MRQQLYYSDLVALVKEFTGLIGNRLQSVYNVGDTHIYLLKFQSDTGKVFVGLQGGSFILQLCHPPTTRPKIPSSFCQKLRKHLKNKRLTKVSLLNQDRIVDFQFGSDSFAHHLIVEMYGDGNVVLTDSEYTILTFIYPQRYQGKRIKVKTNYLSCLKSSDIPAGISVGDSDIPNLKQLESQLVRQYGKDISKETVFQIKSDNQHLTHEICQSHLQNVLQQITEPTSGGYLYEDMCNPTKYEYLKGKSVKSTYSTFSEALENYLSVRWSVHLKTDTERDANSVAENIPLVEQQRSTMIRHYTEKVSKLQTDLSEIRAVIEYLTDHPELVQQTLRTPSDISGSDRTISHQTGTSLGDINLRAKISYYDNLNYYHQQRKSLGNRLEKTHQGHKTALANFQQRQLKLEVTHNPTPKIKLQTDNWYQTYHWFVTSHGYLVICGRNSSQNETVVKRYLESRDIYLHSEIAGCGSAVLKVPAGVESESIHPVDLEEAGAFVICHSRAWRDRVPDRAYWTYSNQVSKTTETGEYVQKGSFIVRGRRNYLSQIKLELGLTVHDSKLMIAPYRRLGNLPATDKVKITPGKGKRNQGVCRIIDKLQLTPSDKHLVDMIVPFQSQFA